MAPFWAASTISAITLPLSSAFYHRPFTETFQIQKRSEKYGRAGSRQRESAEESREGVLLLPWALVCCRWRVQMLKEGMIANKRGQKTRVGSAVTAALLLCVFNTTMSAILYLNFSVHYKHNHWGMMLLWRAASHSTSTVQCTVLNWDASDLAAEVLVLLRLKLCKFWTFSGSSERAEWLMVRTTRCFSQTARHLLSCGCWVLRILQQEVSRKHPTAFSSSVLETLIVSIAPWFKVLL